MMKLKLVKKVGLSVMIAAIAIVFVQAESFSATDQKGSNSGTGEQSKVRYRKGKDVNFDELLINGQLQRPEISVVTGEVGQGTDGLLRLRENFLDQVAIDFGEVAQ